jgi:outer membrane receptor for ferrienterochelin and colicin
MAQSGSASDILRNVPSVEVDIDGNVSLRGSGDMQILINGRPSPLMGTNRAQALQQIPANTIERIEVITNPSAKYRPDGTAGMINIVLKKNTKAVIGIYLEAIVYARMREIDLAIPSEHFTILIQEN